MSWYVKALKSYATFTGRARRMEYWMFFLVNFLVSLALAVIEAILGGKGLLMGLYSLAVFLPSLAVSVRRLHDTNRSGWWLLIALVPLIGGIVLLVFTFRDGQRGDNQYGPNPKGIETAHA